MRHTYSSPSQYSVQDDECAVTLCAEASKMELDFRPSLDVVVYRLRCLFEVVDPNAVFDDVENGREVDDTLPSSDNNHATGILPVALGIFCHEHAVLHHGSPVVSAHSEASA